MHRLITPQPIAFTGMFRLMVLMVSFTAMGCAAVWQPVKGRMECAGWSMQAPDGWMRLSGPAFTMISKDGPYLQYIFLQEKPLSAGFRHTRQRIERDMLPHEAARVVLANLRNDHRISGFTLLENVPERVGGQPGFKLVFTYRDPQGVYVKTIYYGAVKEDRFFNLRYTAAMRYYFDADLDTFSEMVGSLRLSVAS